MLWVQQPVIRRFAVDTVVSIPDRGSLLLGSFSSAASGRTVYGPLPYGSAVGLSRSHASLSAHVWILDFDAMDEIVLRQARASLERSARPRTAETAREILRARNRGRYLLNGR